MSTEEARIALFCTNHTNLTNVFCTELTESTDFSFLYESHESDECFLCTELTEYTEALFTRILFFNETDEHGGSQKLFLRGYSFLHG